MDKDVGADRALVSDHASYAVDGPAGFDHGESFDPSRLVSIANVLAWARSMPPEKTYTYTDHKGCALCHFLHHNNIAFKSVIPHSWRDIRGVEHSFDEKLEAALVGFDAGFSLNRTYGGLVERLEQVQA